VRVIRTVLGDVPPSEMGHVQPHEHVLCDMSGIVKPWGVDAVWPATAAADRGAGQPASEAAASTRALIEVPVSLENYDQIRRDVINLDNLRLTRIDDAVEELTRYRAVGGAAIVDSTAVGMGRDPSGLATVSRATGVHLVMGSAYYSRQYHPPELDEQSAATIAETIVTDVELGVDDTGVRAGVIGEVGLSWPVHPTELKVLEGACRAQVQTGAPMQLHPGRDPDAPIEAIRAVERFGADSSRTIMSHVDRTLWEPAALTQLARTGCFVELDLFGQESSYYAFNPQARRPNDRTRLEWIADLCEQGFADQILISQDICQKVYLRKYGGPGYTHILENVIPLMRRMGFDDRLIRTLTHDNPATALGMEAST
jgi:phosphotriesterase-related protein